MIINKPTHIDFSRMIDKTRGLSENAFESYSNVKYLLAACKHQGVPIIGNPFYPLENKFLSLHYSSLQHLINCEVYKGIFTPNTQDNLLIEQIQGLILMSKELDHTYQNLERQLTSVQDSFRPSILLSA